MGPLLVLLLLGSLLVLAAERHMERAAVEQEEMRRDGHLLDEHALCEADLGLEVPADEERRLTLGNVEEQAVVEHRTVDNLDHLAAKLRWQRRQLLGALDVVLEREHRIYIERHAALHLAREVARRREVVHECHLVAAHGVRLLDRCDRRDNRAEQRREEDCADHHHHRRVDLLSDGVRRNPRYLDERGKRPVEGRQVLLLDG
mmetsp:Transcript_31904/g.83459  ORF Transcript_31904/g.83459 Transcript_31904/m.83459 type:complete len:203 (-) Transcript_31904:873-1481(-)